MKKVLVLGALLSVFFIPSVSHAAITITNVTVNGATSTQVKPLSIVRVSMTVQVTGGSKWEGVQWGINNAGQVIFPAFVNVDDVDRRDYDGDGWRDGGNGQCDDYREHTKGNHNGGNGTFTEKFYIIAPRQNGVYDANFQAFEKKKGNNKVTPSSAIFTLPNAIRVGTATPPPPPPVDTVAPVIAPHADVAVVGTVAGATVTYSDPTATDNKDASVAVSCMPSSGTIFAVGTTTVTCDASDAAGNAAVPMSFNVYVTLPPPTPFTMSSQPDESYLCAPDWENCFTGGTPRAFVNLGSGASLQGGTIKSVTIAKDESNRFVSQPWIVELRCYTDAAYSNLCSDWLTPTAWNGNDHAIAAEFTTLSTDQKHWTADFTDPTHQMNADGSSPLRFRPEYFYQLVINDNLWDIGAYGSLSLGVPYYVLTGITQ